MRNERLDPNPSQPPLIRGGASSALPLTRGSWRGFEPEGQFGINESDAWQPRMQQQLFRGLLEAFSYPGRIAALRRPPVLRRGWQSWRRWWTGKRRWPTRSNCCPMHGGRNWKRGSVSPEQAAFVLLDGSRAPELNPRLGTLEAPEAGATLLLRVESLHGETGGELNLRLSGPGIRQHVALGVSGLHPAWIAARNAWVENFPLGIEMVLCDETRFVALPRTTRIVMGDAA